MTTLGERLRQVRGKTSQEQFARLLELNKNSVGSYERGERTPNANTLSKIVVKCGVSPYWLLSGEGPMYPGDQAKPAPTPTPGASSDEVDYLRREVQELREENRGLREEHKALREENKGLREENRELRRIEAEWLRTRPDKEDSDDTGRLRNSA